MNRGDESTPKESDSEPGAATPVGLYHALTRLGRGWVRFLRARSGPDLADGPARWRVLAALGARGPLMLREIARELGATPRAATALVDGLEAGGLVRRRPHPTDRRASLVALTPAGEAHRRALLEAHLAAASDLFGDLDEEEQRQLLRLLAKVNAGLARREEG